MNELLNNIDISGLVVAALTLTVSGIIGFWFKDVPKYIVRFILRMITTEILIDNQCGETYYNIISYIERNFSNRKFRKYKMDSTWCCGADRDILSIGYGTHFISYKHQILCINVFCAENSSFDTNRTVINKIRIIKLGRNNKLIKTFISECSIEQSRYMIDDKIRINGCDQKGYNQMMYANKRHIDKIYLNEGVSEKIIETIDNFVNNRDWYIENGIPYHLGIFLHGVPGTGKTSIIKAIASKYNLTINYISSGNMKYIQRIIATAESSYDSKHSLFVFEDIDSCNAVLDRNNTDNIITHDKDSDNVKLSDVLNVFDGLMSRDGSIIICTTNHIENIDPAVFRPGRIDLCVNIDYMDRHAINLFMQNFYKKDLPDDCDISLNITCAELQNLLLQNYSYDDMVKYITNKI